MAKKLPFKVSARTARLIGRENVSNFDGAIIELVKNSYDAGSKICIIYVNNKFENVPGTLTDHEFQKLSNDQDLASAIIKSYQKEGQHYKLSDISKEQYILLAKLLRDKNELYIIDNGSGMDQTIIESLWMTIGTNNKEIDFMGIDGRVKTGAKGIGRFALDRLGNSCVMLTATQYTDKAVRWNVEWNQFERQDANIDDVFAEVEEIDKYEYTKYISELLSFDKDLSKKFDFSNGTIFTITGLRDVWNEYSVNSVYSNLETLIPPTDDNIFNVFLYSSLEPGKYGQIRSYVCDDFDYKLHAVVNEDRSVTITTHRNEFNLSSIDKELFKYKDMMKAPYDQETFQRGVFVSNKKIEELMSGYHGDKLISEIGPFEFTLYFLKRIIGNNDDRKKYHYKEIPNNRGKWLDKFGGIKLYRDFFRIRPYGEVGSNAFDWLELGQRADKSPGGPTQSGGGRLKPNQVVGVIKISRLTNIAFEDKSNREGLQENRVFMLFKQLILEIIGVLETDRSIVMTNMLKMHKEKYKIEETKSQGKELAQNIRKNKEKITNEKSVQGLQLQLTYVNDQEEKELLADTLAIIEEEKEQLLTELQLMRTMASTGLVITSFAHELQNLSEKISRRANDFKKVLDPLIDKEILEGLEDYKDPYVLIEDIRKQDEKLKYWLDFALNSVRKDKRTLKKQNLYDVFSEVHRTWESILTSKGVNYRFPQSDNSQFLFRIFQIDVDTIFNNLITNSLAAFTRRDASGNNQITIDFYQKENRLIFFYEDTGPGLSTEISDPNIIFTPFFTTKRDLSGKEIGTGLGMWLVKSAVDYYNGEIIIERANPGFRLTVSFPLKSDEGVVVDE